MKKFIIPSVLAAVVLIAGMFAFMPVDKATSVHTSILAGTSQIVSVSGTAAPRQTNITPAAGGDATDRTSCVKTSTTSFEVLGVTFNTSTDANGNLDLAAFADGELSTDLNDDPGVDIGGAFNPLTTDDNIAYLQVNGATATPIVGTTTVSLGPLADAAVGDAADEVTVIFVLRVSGSDSATSFTCTRS